MSEQKPVFPETKWGEFDSLADLRRASLQEGRFSVTLDGGRFEACYWPKPGKRLYVLLSGARDLKTKAWPNFDRWSWAPLFPGSVLCIADPTLALDTTRLRIGWYAGTATQDWTQSLADLVRQVSHTIGAFSSQVICYGSSAGGFGALALAARLGDATAVAINPQTDVLKYHVRPVRQFLKLAFPDQDGKEALTPGQRLRLSALEAVLAATQVKCLLVQNRKDLHHYREHFTPLAKRAGVDLRRSTRTHPRIWTMLYDGTAKHGPEPRNMVVDIIAAAEALCRQGRDDDASPLASASPQGATHGGKPPLAKTAAQAAPPETLVQQGSVQEGKDAEQKQDALDRSELEIEARIQDRHLVVRAKMQRPAQYSFYLYKDQERIAVQKYAESNEARWPLDTEGTYWAKVYVLGPDGTKISGRSRSLQFGGPTRRPS